MHNLYRFLTVFLTLTLVGISAFPKEAFAADTLVDSTTNPTYGLSAPTMAWIDDQTGFIFYNGAEDDLEMASTTDGGATWSAGRTVDSINTTDVVNYAIWWDGWTPTSSTPTTIHITTIDSGVDDSYYTPYNVVTNTLGTTTLVSTQSATCARNNTSACPTSITRATNGDLYISAMDTSDRWVMQCLAGTDCTSTGNWTEVTPLAVSAAEGMFIITALTGSNNIFGIWRNSGTAIKWGEFSATSTTWHASGTLSGTYAATADSRYTGFGLSSATTSPTTTVQVLWDANDIVSQDNDIRFYEYVSGTGLTQKTDVVTNSSGTINGIAAFVDNSSTTQPVYYSVYNRRTISVASNFVATSSNIYYRTSSDFGNTWSSEQGPVNDVMDSLTGPLLGFSSNQRLGVGYIYITAPYTEQLFYNQIADLTPWTPPGGGGGGPTPTGIPLWWGGILPMLLPFRKRAR